MNNDFYSKIKRIVGSPNMVDGREQWWEWQMEEILEAAEAWQEREARMVELLESFRTNLGNPHFRLSNGMKSADYDAVLRQLLDGTEHLHGDDPTILDFIERHVMAIFANLNGEVVITWTKNGREYETIGSNLRDAVKKAQDHQITREVK